MARMPTLVAPRRGWRARLFAEPCADCGAPPHAPCRVAYGKGPERADPFLPLAWAHTQQAGRP